MRFPWLFPGGLPPGSPGHEYAAPKNSAEESREVNSTVHFCAVHHERL